MKKQEKIFLMLAILVFNIVIFDTEVYALSIETIPIVKNVQVLMKDLIRWLTIILPIVSLAMIIFCQIRKTMADEHEKAQWDKRTIGVIISLALGLSATVIINLIIKMTDSGGVIV